MYLYRITNNINGKIYIGITNNYKRRWANHGLDDSVIGLAIKKYGKQNFTFEVLFSGVPIEKIDELEIEQIKLHNSLVPNGYNVSKGGNYGTWSQKVDSRGNLNSHASLSYEEAKYIKDHRNEPMYLLYEKYCDKITYGTFKKIYKNKTYLNIEPTVPEYPDNMTFSEQFSTTAKLTYEDVCELREKYAKGIYWEKAYEEYKNLYPNKWEFWNIYYGNRYFLVMPEVFTSENRVLHSSLGKKGERNGRAKLTTEDVKRIRKLHADGISNSEIYVLYPQVTKTSIRDVINCKTWKDVF